jgi:hypothetical protein
LEANCPPPSAAAAARDFRSPAPARRYNRPQRGRIGRTGVAILAGIDEAGFGPVLGPLVVSAAVFELPDELLGVSLWDLLSGAVSRKPSAKRPAVAIADSKTLYSRRRSAGLAHLERGVLGMLAASGSRPATLGRLLAAAAPGARKHLARYAWYADGDMPLPRAVSATDLSLAANALRVAMREAGVALRAVRSECVFAAEYNEMAAATRNKSLTLLSVTGRLLAHVWRSGRDPRVRICVDRQGGRQRYLRHLQRMFEGLQFKVVDETETVSAYAMSDGRRTAEIIFATAAEQRHLPVALASMASKYLRELFMAQLNGFWAAHVPDLAPTAGYYVDGRRFFRDIRPAAAKLGVDERLLYRSR